MISGSAIHQRNCCHRRVGVEMIRGRIKDGDRPRREEEASSETYLDSLLIMRIGNKLMQIAELIRIANVLKIRKGPLVIVRWIVDIIFLVNDL